SPDPAAHDVTASRRPGAVTGAGDGVRLAELVAALSLATDLGLGQPQQHIIRQTLIAMRVGELEGLSDDERSAIFYVSLLAWVGCVADAHEMGKWFDDDMAVRADSYLVDLTGLPMMRFMIGHVANDVEALHRIGGVDAAVEMLRSRRGTEFDPELVDRFCSHAGELLAFTDELDGWDTLIGGHDALERELSGEELDQALEAFADYADVKSPFTLGHSRGVALLAAAAAA